MTWSWPAHPDDEWIDVSTIDRPGQLIRGRSVYAHEAEMARAAYLAGAIDVEEFEDRIGHALAGKEYAF